MFVKVRPAVNSWHSCSEYHNKICQNERHLSQKFNTAANHDGRVCYSGSGLLQGTPFLELTVGARSTAPPASSTLTADGTEISSFISLVSISCDEKVIFNCFSFFGVNSMIQLLLELTSLAGAAVVVVAATLERLGTRAFRRIKFWGCTCV